MATTNRKSSRVTLQQLAGYRAARTKLANAMANASASDSDDLADRIARLDSIIGGARVIKASATAQTIKALKAHCTRAKASLAGTRGNARKAIMAKIADYESRIADRLAPPAPANNAAAPASFEPVPAGMGF